MLTWNTRDIAQIRSGGKSYRVSLYLDYGEPLYDLATMEHRSGFPGNNQWIGMGPFSFDDWDLYPTKKAHLCMALALTLNLDPELHNKAVDWLYRRTLDYTNLMLEPLVKIKKGDQ